MPRFSEAPVERVDARVYTVPTDRPESDGTFEWSSTTLVIVEAAAAGARGLGYSYTSAAAARLIQDVLAPIIRGRDALSIPEIFAAMNRAVRNVGRPGIAATAISAVDVALWDLKARLFDVPLVTLLGASVRRVPVYWSGGFTSYSEPELQEQLSRSVEAGIRRVKMKVGRDVEQDPARVRAARRAIGEGAELFVDANGAYTATQALALAHRFAEFGVSWFEEPVSSDNLDDLRLIRERAPAGMAIAAGEYGYEPTYFRRMLRAAAVDVLQADATRCLGITGFRAVDALCEAHDIPLSTHCAPALHLHVACASLRLRHMEFFHDHVRIENTLFEGAPNPSDGMLEPDLTQPGLGLTFRASDAARFES